MGEKGAKTLLKPVKTRYFDLKMEFAEVLNGNRQML